MFEGLDRFRAVGEELLDADLDKLSRDELLEFTREFETLRRRLTCVDHAIVAQLEERGTAHELATRSSSRLLQQTLRLSRSEAGRRVRAAKQMGPRRALSGEPLEPLRPHIAAAQRAGVVSPEQARVITGCLDQLPASTPVDEIELAERKLVGYAHAFAPTELRTLADRLIDAVNPDGTLPPGEQQRRRWARLQQRPDGSYELKGRLTPECGAAWQAVFSALGKPEPHDTRSTGQRTHPALLDAASRLLGSQTLPECNGVPTVVLLTMDIDQLEARLSKVTTAHGGTLSVEDALRMAATGGVVPIVFNDTGGVLRYGRRRRFASLGQTYALYARDLRCTFPGCDRPAAWCHRDHLVEFRRGGATDTHLLQVLCDYHDLHARKRGWTPLMINGVPHWVPPDFVDPEQRPRRNPQPERDTE